MYISGGGVGSSGGSGIVEIAFKTKLSQVIQSFVSDSF